MCVEWDKLMGCKYNIYRSENIFDKEVVNSWIILKKNMCSHHIINALISHVYLKRTLVF